MKQKILITGGTSGCGAGAAHGLAKDHHVTVAGETWQQVTAFRERADEASVTLEVIKLDLLNDLDIAHAADCEVDVLAPMPPAGPVMLLQHDPQPMIDVIPDKGSAYRTMLAEYAVVETKLGQELASTNKAHGTP